MVFADCHTHSSCSPDGGIPMVEMAKTALQYGLTTLCLTDHCDLLSLDGTQRTLEYDWIPLLRQRKEMLDRFGTKLDLPLGLEHGMGFLVPEASKKILSQPGLDFVIGSVHNLSEEAGGGDFYYQPYDTLEHCYQALDNYFASLETMAAGAFYDVVGHIIYPLRYMGDFAPLVKLDRYTDQICRIMTLAVDSGRGIEINTWKGQTLQEWIPILRLYRQCRGEIITVGSDAHATQPIGRGVSQAYALMKESGFRYVAVYHQRQPEMLKLN